MKDFVIVSFTTRDFDNKHSDAVQDAIAEIVDDFDPVQVLVMPYGDFLERLNLDENMPYKSLNVKRKLH